MFRLIRAIVALVILLALAYGAVFIPLGDKTLVQHLRAIASTEESQEFVEGVKQKATEVIREHTETDASPDEQAQPEDSPTALEKARLRRLLREKLGQKAAK